MGLMPKSKSQKQSNALLPAQPNKIEINFYDESVAKDNLISSCKYKWWSFIFLFLFQQYQKPSNVFYLIQALSNLIPGASVINPFSAFTPVIFVLAVAAIREILEDIGRFKADKQVNSLMYKILRDGKEMQICSSDIKQGDILFIQNKQEVPADSVLLYSSNDSKIGFISTASLDGESNLKIRSQLLPYSIKEKQHDKVFNVFQNFFGRVTVQPPSNDMHKFNGKMFVFQEIQQSLLNDQSSVLINNEQNYHLEEIVNFQMDNVLLRGVRLQNTQEVVAAVVYTAKDTRLMQNQLPSKPKTSRLDDRINFLILIITILALSLIVLFSVLGYQVQFPGITFSLESVGALKALQRFVQYLIICSYLLPISLFVTIEIVRFFQSLLIDVDKNLRRKDILQWQLQNKSKPISQSPFFCESAVQHSVQVKNSISVENLAEVDIIFSDKTGTLTKNLMTFHSFIDKNNNVFDVNKAMKNQQCPIKDIDDSTKFSLALCNTVLPQIENDEVVYQAESPDEISFVQAANQFGLQFKLKHSKVIFFEYSYQGKQINLQYEVLAVVPFTSGRKKMSIVLKELGSTVQNDLQNFADFEVNGVVFCTPQDITQPGQIFVLSKGADSFIMPSMNIAQNLQFYQKVQYNVDNFSKLGLRTLAFGSKQLLNAQNWLNQWETIKQLSEADDRYLQLTEELETNLVFQCVSAIEDELQDDLQETLKSIISTGIKVWMLTGDKTLTAVNIAKSAGLSQPDSQFIYLTAESFNDVIKDSDKAKRKAQEKQALNSLLDQGISIQTKNLPQLEEKEYFDQLHKLYTITNKSQSKSISSLKSLFTKSKKISESNMPITVVLDTDIFKMLIKHNLQYKFFHVAVFSQSVVCCRLSPQEKALIVNLAHQFQPHLTTLAIGDGANDVVMIKTAQIGVGVAGREGLHACNSADISIPQFSFLKRVLFVHGRISHFRNSQLVDYCIFKNSMITFVNLTFAFSSKITGSIVSESLLLMIFNTFMTFIPIAAYSLTEKDVYDTDLVNYPQSLRFFVKRYSPNFFTIIVSLFYGLICSQLIYQLSTLIFSSGLLFGNGLQGDLYTLQVLVMGSICIVSIMRVYVITKIWNWVVVGLLFLSFVAYWACYLVGNWFTGFGVGLHGQLLILFSTPIYWVVFILLTFLGLLPGFLYQSLQRLWVPTTSDILMQAQNKDCKVVDEETIVTVDDKYKQALALIYK